MAPNNNSAVSAKSFIEAINQSYAHLFRALIFFILVFVFFILALIVFFNSVINNAEFSTEFTKEGGVIIHAKKSNLLSADESKTYATFLLPSNAAWFDTGLELKPGQECAFKITGRVHLAVQRIVESAARDTICPIPWSDAHGNAWANIGDNDSQLAAKQDLLLKPSTTIGNVVGYYIPTDETTQFQEYFKKNRDKLTTNVFEVNREKTIPNTFEKNIKIYLSVNDILLGFTPPYDKKSEIAYCGERPNNKRLKKWSEIKGSNYSNLYFDDNIGSFLVQVEIKNKKQ